MTDLQEQAAAITKSLEKDQEFILKLKREMQMALMESSQQVGGWKDVQRLRCLRDAHDPPLSHWSSLVGSLR